MPLLLPLRIPFQSDGSAAYEKLPLHTSPTRHVAWLSKVAASRTSASRAYLAVCVLTILYLGFFTAPSYFPPIEIVRTQVYQLAEDICIDQLQSLLPPGSFFKFSNTSIFDNFYVPIKPIPQAERQNPERQVAFDVPLHCLDEHLALGAPCVSDEPSPALDVVWTYVNGTDKLHQLSYNETMKADKASNRILAQTLKIKPGSLREFDELRYSMRSVLANFRQSTGRFVLVGSDFPWPNCGEYGSRLGQLPQWLHPEQAHGDETWRDGEVSMRAVHHNTIFGDLGNKSILNSFAIESQLGNIPGLSDNFIYMNDDMFFSHELRTEDFFRKDLGPVIRVYPNLVISATGTFRGEWVAVYRANELLNDRFGLRSRPYVAHFPKTMSVSVLNEVTTIWSEDFAKTASHSFRSLNARFEPDVSPAILMAHYVVERWREALLWSFIVGRIGGDEDEWTQAHTRRVWEEIGADPKETFLKIERRARTTLEQADAFLREMIGEERSWTEYTFSGYDGYPYYKLGQKGWPKWPSFTPQDDSGKLQDHVAHSGTLPDSCFRLLGVTPITSATEIFKHFAFRMPGCGDLLINALMSKASSGIEAFLPPPDRQFPKDVNATAFRDSDLVPRLPMTPNWRESDFSLSSMHSGDLSVRQWTLRALIRYRFVLGHTHAEFAMNTSPRSVIKNLEKIDKLPGTEDDPALICINDDVTTGEDEVRQTLKQWFRKKWPTPAEWETTRW